VFFPELLSHHSGSELNLFKTRFLPVWY